VSKWRDFVAWVDKQETAADEALEKMQRSPFTARWLTALIFAVGFLGVVFLLVILT
jgi:hypothetical protein